MKGRDYRDYLVAALFVAVWTAGTYYIFRYPSVPAFTAWCGLATTMTTAFHWLNIYDDKHPDSPCSPPSR